MPITQSKMKEIIDRLAKELLDKDIIHDDGVVINGKSNDKNDLVVYTSHEGYNEFIKKVLTDETN